MIHPVSHRFTRLYSIHRALFALTAALTLWAPTSAQQPGPWNSPLRYAWSTDGRNFGASAVFQDSAGVPSVIRGGGDTLIAAFQWFRGPQNGPAFDRIAIKKSFDGGATWTQPVTAVFSGYPKIVRAFDPALLRLPDGRIRMYFSSRPGSNAELDSTVDTYSATSSDGFTYAYDSVGPVFGNPTRQVIDPSVVLFGNKVHLTAPIGAFQEGAYHAESAPGDGLHFTTLAPYPSENGRNWTGNYCGVDSVTLRFYGAGANGPWYKETTDPSNWPGPYVLLGMQGGDPAVVRTASGQYLIVYVGPPYSTAVRSAKDKVGNLRSPSVVGSFLQLPPGTLRYRVLSLDGRAVRQGAAGTVEVDLAGIAPGGYRLEWTDADGASHDMAFTTSSARN